MSEQTEAEGINKKLLAVMRDVERIHKTGEVGHWAPVVRVTLTLRVAGYLENATSGCYGGKPHEWSPACRCTRCGMSKKDVEDKP